MDEQMGKQQEAAGTKGKKEQQVRQANNWTTKRNTPPDEAGGRNELDQKYYWETAGSLWYGSTSSATIHYRGYKYRSMVFAVDINVTGSRLTQFEDNGTAISSPVSSSTCIRVLVQYWLLGTGCSRPRLLLPSSFAPFSISVAKPQLVSRPILSLVRLDFALGWGDIWRWAGTLDP